MSFNKQILILIWRFSAFLGKIQFQLSVALIFVFFCENQSVKKITFGHDVVEAEMRIMEALVKQMCWNGIGRGDPQRIERNPGIFEEPLEK